MPRSKLGQVSVSIITGPGCRRVGRAMIASQVGRDIIVACLARSAAGR